MVQITVLGINHNTWGNYLICGRLGSPSAFLVVISITRISLICRITDTYRPHGEYMALHNIERCTHTCSSALCKQGHFSSDSVARNTDSRR